MRSPETQAAGPLGPLAFPGISHPSSCALRAHPVAHADILRNNGKISVFSVSFVPPFLRSVVSGIPSHLRLLDLKHLRLLDLKHLPADLNMPDALTTTPTSDPTLLYRYRDAMYAPDMLIVGLHLDLFTRLASQPSTLDAICATFEIAPRPADVMLTLFAAMGLVERTGDRYETTRTAREHLVKDSP